MNLKALEWALGALFLLLVAVIGWLAVADVSLSTRQPKRELPVEKPILITQPAVNKNSGSSRLSATKSNALESLLARPKERLVQFDNEEDYRRFISSLDSSKLRLLGAVDALRAARVGFDSLTDFDGLLDPEETGYNFLVSPPLPPGEGQIQPGAIGFRGNALDWLGITGDNSQWGKDVTIAVIDTGIVDHQALPANIRHFDLVEQDGNSAEPHGHGTAVASLIAGTNEITPGVAPASNLIDVRVADSEGNSSSFQLAEGIVLAADQGADVINVSMGSLGNSPIVKNAVEYAYENGSVVVASSGNEGLTQPSFPAAYEQVYAVGAVDREGALVDFSNTGENLDLTAPGLEVYAAWTDDRYIEFSGTSASAPYVSAAIATAMSEFNLTATQAANYVLNYTNEAGPPGADSGYGEGHLDVGRVTDSQTPGLYDIAAVSNLVTSGEVSSVVSVVQNQGTETVSNAQVNISTPYAEIPLRVASLAPGEVQTFEIPTSLPSDGSEFLITTETTLPQSFQDIDPRNNVKSTAFDLSLEP